MSEIGGLSSLTNQYDSITAENSLSTLSSFEPVSQLEDTSSCLLGTQAPAASSIDGEMESIVIAKTNSLAELYSDANDLSSAANSLYSATQDSSSLSLDDVSNFVSAYNNFVSYSGQNSQYISANDWNAIKENITDAQDSLSDIGITVNSDGTLSVDEDTLNSSLANNPSDVASTLNSLADATKSSSSTLVSNSLANYTASYRQSLVLSTELNEYETQSALLGQLFDTKA